ncbi:MAG: FmdB family zinc ribbon protein [Verrucomicrobiota bacterium]
MPVYDFECPICGPFTAFRSINERDEPLECAACAMPASRLISAPNLALMNPSIRKAVMVNERSAHAPRVSTGHSCNNGCGCGSKIRKGRTKQTRVGLAQAAKAGARPWMLGH